MKKIRRLGIKPIVVTLTSIPPRFGNLPEVFGSLLRQSRKPHKVELNIPQSYRRFPGEVPSLPPLPDWVEVHRGAFDYGPASKLLPTVDRWRGADVDLLVFDDDQKHDCNWIERFVTARHQNPDDVICQRGWQIDTLPGITRSEFDEPRFEPPTFSGKDWTYRLKRVLSLGLARPYKFIEATPGYVDIFEGVYGALIPPSAIPDAAKNIPDVIWTVDDVWLSGMIYQNNRKIWVHGLPHYIQRGGGADQIEALGKFSYGGYDRSAANRLAVEYLRKTYGIWP